MEQVSRLEVDLGRAVGKYAQKVATQNSITEQKDYTIRSFLNVEEDYSENHKKLKKKSKHGNYSTQAQGIPKFYSPVSTNSIVT